jgi:hypothetical protein
MTISTNVAPRPTDGHFVAVNHREEMERYDALPPRWRALVGSLPVLQAIEPVNAYRAALGDDVAYARVVDTFRRKFPGWTPP